MNTSKTTSTIADLLRVAEHHLRLGRRVCIVPAGRENTVVFLIEQEGGRQFVINETDDTIEESETPPAA